MPGSVRQQRVSRLRHPAVFTMSNEANPVMPPLDLLDDLGGSVGRAVVDDDDLARGPRLCQRAIQRTPDGLFRVVARDPDGDERSHGVSTRADGHYPIPLCSPTANPCTARFAPTL